VFLQKEKINLLQNGILYFGRGKSRTLVQ